MILAERADLEQVEIALQSAVICCGVVVRKVSCTCGYRLVPPGLAHSHHHSSRYNYAQALAALLF